MGLERLYKVPDDVSIMGMDDLLQAAFHNPPLTAMHIPMREIGAAALNLLLDDLGGLSMPPRRVEHRLPHRRAAVRWRGRGSS